MAATRFGDSSIGKFLPPSIRILVWIPSAHKKLDDAMASVTLELGKQRGGSQSLLANHPSQSVTFKFISKTTDSGAIQHHSEGKVNRGA